MNKLSEYLSTLGNVGLRGIDGRKIIGFIKWLSTTAGLPTIKSVAATTVVQNSSESS
jgi:hypothetical protein